MRNKTYTSQAAKYYFTVTNPEGRVRLETAESKFEAIAKSVQSDGYKWSNSQYKAIKTK